jgi:hypothetical protein
MKIKEVFNPDFGKAFYRISQAFHQHTPDNIEWVEEGEDFQLIHAVGEGEYEYAKKQDLSKLIIIAHCILTTKTTVQQWEEIWKEAKLVISFHPINTYTEEKINFIRSPWGAEPDLFPAQNKDRRLKVFMTGHVAETECLDKVFEACKITENVAAHTGEDFHWAAPWYKYFPYFEQKDFATMLNIAQYISCLRKVEGFEMMGIEGAMTGAVPIVPNEPTYDYYKDFGIFLDMKKDVTKQLIDIFGSTYYPLTKSKIDYVRREFSWEKICKRIYKRF